MAMLKVGLRAQNLPTEEEKLILITHLIENYGNHTLQELNMAFDMAIAGKLDLTRADVVCYENFSCLYLSGIMNAFRAWAGQAWREMKHTDTPTQRIYTDAELEAMCRYDIEMFYQRCRAGKVPHCIPHYFLPQLIKDGFMAEGSDDMAAFFSERLNAGAAKLYEA